MYAGCRLGFRVTEWATKHARRYGNSYGALVSIHRKMRQPLIATRASANRLGLIQYDSIGYCRLISLAWCVRGAYHAAMLATGQGFNSLASRQYKRPMLSRLLNRGKATGLMSQAQPRSIHRHHSLNNKQRKPLRRKGLGQSGGARQDVSTYVITTYDYVKKLSKN
jgi:hypothetical protein